MQIKTNINILSHLNSFDWFVFTIILALTFSFVLWGHFKKEKTLNKEENFLDHLILGRKLTLPLFVATLVASWYGGIFGVTTFAFKKGIFTFLTQGLFWHITYIIFALFIVDKIKKYKAITLPDLIHKMFGPRSAKLGALFIFINVLPIAYCMSLGFFLQMFFDLDLQILIVIGTGIVVLYSLFDGFRAVIYSDLIQFFIMCSSVFIILLFSYIEFGGWSFLKEHLPTQHLNLTGGESLATTFTWGLIALATLIDPNFYQRCFAANSTRTAKSGILWSTVIWILFDICTTGGALYAKAVMPNAHPDNAYLIYAMQLLPHGLRGFVLAGILATILSTLDSYLFIGGTTLSFDGLPLRWRRKISMQRMGIIIVGIMTVLLVPFAGGSITNLWKTLGSYQAAGLLFPVMFGYFFPNKISDNQFLIISLSGVIATTIGRSMEDLKEIALYMGIITAIVVTMACLLKSKSYK